MKLCNRQRPQPHSLLNTQKNKISAKDFRLFYCSRHCCWRWGGGGRRAAEDGRGSGVSGHGLGLESINTLEKYWTIQKNQTGDISPDVHSENLPHLFLLKNEKCCRRFIARQSTLSEAAKIKLSLFFSPAPFLCMAPQTACTTLHLIIFPGSSTRQKSITKMAADLF